nr:hypothetical protein [Rhizobium sp. CG5]
METAIRSALERSDRANAEIRARIYQSARHALEGGLRKQNINDPETVAQQRHRLETVIHGIEQEERGRLATPGRAEPEAPVMGDQPANRHDRQDPPSVDGHGMELRAERHREPAPSADMSDLRAERDSRVFEDQDVVQSPPSAAAVHPQSLDIRPEAVIHHKKHRRGFFSRLFIFTVLLVTVGMGAWWIYTSGLLMTAAERDTSVPNPPPHAEEEDFSGNISPQPQPLDPGFSDEWIEVFGPNQIEAVKPRGNALVDVVTTGDGPAVQLTSRSADADGSVAIDVPVEVLRDMAGRVSTIALTLRSASDKPVQISVECDFDRLGDCARHRFTVNPEKADILFQIDFERGIAPATPGQLLVNGDLSGQGQGVNLYSVRVLPGQ